VRFFCAKDCFFRGVLGARALPRSRRSVDEGRLVSLRPILLLPPSHFSSVQNPLLTRPPLWDVWPSKHASVGRDPRELRTPQDKGDADSTYLNACYPNPSFRFFVRMTTKKRITPHFSLPQRGLLYHADPSPFRKWGAYVLVFELWPPEDRTSGLL
jgi:hypothetical protein